MAVIPSLFMCHYIRDIDSNAQSMIAIIVSIVRKFDECSEVLLVVRCSELSIFFLSVQGLHLTPKPPRNRESRQDHHN